MNMKNQTQNRIWLHLEMSVKTHHVRPVKDISQR